MQTFFAITSKRNPTSTGLLKTACSQRNIEYKELDIDTFPWDNPPLLQQGDMLYRITDDERGTIIEKILLQKGIATFYSTFEGGFSEIDNVIAATRLHEIHGLLLPKTIYVTSATHDQLEKASQTVGGFPLILKVQGGQHGIGVIKIDSLDTLVSVADLLIKQQTFFVLRQFIRANSHARLIVLGDKVVDSIRYIAPQGDFRTNVEQSQWWKHALFL